MEKLDSSMAPYLRLASNSQAVIPVGILVFVNPPLAISLTAHKFDWQALNHVVKILLAIFVLWGLRILKQFIIKSCSKQQAVIIEVNASKNMFSEEERSLQPSVFTVIRELLAFFKLPMILI